VTLRDDVARYLVSDQPPSIRRRMIEDRQLRDRLGLSNVVQVTAGEATDLPRAKLFQAVREALSDRHPRTIDRRRGGSVVVGVAEGHVQFSFDRGEGKEEVRVLDMMLLSPHVADRVQTFQSLVDDTGPTGPDPVKWSAVIEERSLDDDEFQELAAEVADSIPVRIGKARAVLFSTGSVDWRDIIPTSLRYYERLCGPDPGEADPDVYLKTIVQAYRTTLIRRDLRRGLDLCLVGFLRDDLSPAVLVDATSDGEIWTAVERAASPSDPFTALGLLDIALGRSAKDERFRSLAVSMMDRLSPSEFLQANKLNLLAAIPGLVGLIEERFHHVEGMVRRPPFWRRFCAWTHAGLIARCLDDLQFASDAFEKWSDSLRAREDVFFEIADLRAGPMWTCNSLSPHQLRAEIVGRMAAMSARYRQVGVAVDLCEKIDAVVREFDASPSGVQRLFAGPLEGHVRPADRRDVTTLSDENGSRLGKKLSPRLWSKVWGRVALAARIWTLGDELLARIREIIPDAEFGRNNDQRRRAFNNLAHLCQVAAAHRDHLLGKAIGSRCVTEAPKVSSADDADRLLRVILMAAAAIQDNKEWADWLDNTLRALVANLKKGQPCAVVHESLQVLIRYLPEYRRCVARPSALSELGM